MNKIIIYCPSHLSSQDQMKSCLDAASRVGFSVPSIEFITQDQTNDLSASVVTDSSRLNIVSIFTDSDLSVESDVILAYQVDTSPALADNVISIAIPDGDILKDRLLLANGIHTDLHYIHVRWTTESSIRHFCWFVLSVALGFTLEDAAILANSAVKQYQFVSRETWPSKSEYFPELAHLPWRQLNAPFKLIPQDMGLYPVVDSVLWLEKLLKLGVKTLQLRIKDATQKNLETEIQKAIALGKHYKAQLFINDYWQLAIKHQAYGVHLGQEDIEEADLSKIYQAGIRLGISTHGYYEVLRAKQLQPSYIALGHIFPTTTKDMPSEPQGLVKLNLYQKLIGRSFPTVAIGGIDLNNAQQVWQCGVSSLAVVRAITQANDIQLAIDSFYQIMASPRSHKAIA